MSLLALSASLEYLCYGSTLIINILIFPVRGLSDSDVLIFVQFYPPLSSTAKMFVKVWNPLKGGALFKTFFEISRLFTLIFLRQLAFFAQSIYTGLPGQRFR